MMGTLLIGCGLYKCSDGTFECSLNSYPDISHVMGLPPLNKLYAIMLTCYSCAKQAYARAYFQRLQPLVSPVTNYFLLGCAVVSIVFGPMIGFFDTYWDVQIHVKVTALFTLGELFYVLTISTVIDWNQASFPQEQQLNIQALLLCRFIAVVLIVVSTGAGFINYDLGNYSHTIEWLAFNMLFVIYGVLSATMKYNSVVTPQ